MVSVTLVARKQRLHLASGESFDGSFHLPVRRGAAMSGVPGISGVAEPVVKGDQAYLAGTLSDAP